MTCKERWVWAQQEKDNVLMLRRKLVLPGFLPFLPLSFFWRKLLLKYDMLCHTKKCNHSRQWGSNHWTLCRLPVPLWHRGWEQLAQAPLRAWGHTYSDTGSRSHPTCYSRTLKPHRKQSLSAWPCHLPTHDLGINGYAWLSYSHLPFPDMLVKHYCTSQFSPKFSCTAIAVYA